MRIGLAAGHSARTEGERLWEWKRCRKVQSRLGELLVYGGHHPVVPPRELYQLDNDAALAAKIAYFNQRRVEVAVELHLNAGGGQYSTCLYWSDGEDHHSEPGKELAGHVARQLALAFPWRSIGPRSQGHMGRQLAFLGETTMPAVIVEPAFVDDPEQRAYLERLCGPVLYATAVFQALCRYADEAKEGKA
ncbi:N-acetylmuramoyl-L-alanine amidase [Candidatus Latescibacterota bacterium]